MARKRRRYGSTSDVHRERADAAAVKSKENAERAIDLAGRGVCGHAAGALASAEYWRGRSDAEDEGAGGFLSWPAKNLRTGKAHDAVSRCISRK